MSQEFEKSLAEKEIQMEIARAISMDREEQKAIKLKAEGDSTSTFNLREEVNSQMDLLSSIRTHFFHTNGTPKEETEASDITSYMANATKLLAMLKSFEDALKTDEDLLKIETAIEMALEDSPCPEFVIALNKHLESDIL